MSKVMRVKVLKVIDVEWSGSTYNHSRYDKYVVEISALDADRVQLNGYFINRKDRGSLLDRSNEWLTVYVKPDEGFNGKNGKIKIKPYITKIYTHEKDGKDVLRKKYQKAVYVQEDN